jgi:hypothetical protein
VLTLTLPSPDEASCWLLSMRALLRLTTLGDREFTLYLLDLFKMADRQTYHGTTYHGTTYHGTTYHGTTYHGTTYHGTTN